MEGDGGGIGVAEFMDNDFELGYVGVGGGGYVEGEVAVEEGALGGMFS